MKLAEIREDSAWADAGLAALDVPHVGVDWPLGGHDPFDLQHDDTAHLYWTRSHPSRLLEAGTHPPLAELMRAMPMGYTTLTVLEKLAVVHDGRLLRLWPATGAAGSSGRLQPYQLVVPPRSGAHYVRLGTTWPVRFAVREAVELSTCTRGPVLVTRVLSHENWH